MISCAFLAAPLRGSNLELSAALFGIWLEHVASGIDERCTLVSRQNTEQIEVASNSAEEFGGLHQAVTQRHVCVVVVGVGHVLNLPTSSYMIWREQPNAMSGTAHLLIRRVTDGPATNVTV